MSHLSQGKKFIQNEQHILLSPLFHRVKDWLEFILVTWRISQRHTENWFELFGALYSVGQWMIRGCLCIHIPLSYFTSINHFGRSSLNWFRSNGTGCLLAIFCGRSGHCRWQENPRSSKGGGQRFVPSSHALYSDELWHTFLYSLIKWEIFKIIILELVLWKCSESVIITHRI